MEVEQSFSEESTCLHMFKTVKFLQDLGRAWTSIIRIGFLHTDTFLMISGLLTSYSLYKQLEQTKRLDISRNYVSRLMRYCTQIYSMCVCLSSLQC